MVECPICKARLVEHPIMYFGEIPDVLRSKKPEYFVLKTKDLKGHKKRYMVCTTEHIKHSPDNYDRILDAVNIGFSLFIDEDFIVLNGVNASIKEHWHVILCDTILDGEKVDIKKEPRIEVYR